MTAEPRTQEARVVYMFLNGGGMRRGELHDLPLETLRDSLLPAEPPEVELGLIELEDGTPSFAVVLRREYQRTAELIDISDIGSWRAYQGDER